MSGDKTDFFGKDVAEAIKKACEVLSVPQEKLDIAVVDTGSTGIFGLIRKKAHIRAVIKTETEPDPDDDFQIGNLLVTERQNEEKIVEKSVTTVAEPVVEPQGEDEEDDEELPVIVVEQEGEASAESLQIVRAEISRIVELMGFPSTLEVEAAGLAVSCTLSGEYEENLAGQDGKVLDSLQYLIRKIISRKVSEKLRVSINVGAFREKRLEELKVKALELATLVKADGKTQILAGLNPSERRIIHMMFQEDKEIRSRSVGEGLFKKILIYKPGKGSRPSGRKRPSGNRRQGKNGPKQNSES